MKASSTSALFLCLAAGLVAGCGGSGPSTGGSGQPANSPVSHPGAGSGTVDTTGNRTKPRLRIIDVAILHGRFDPKLVVTSLGSPVRWTNRDKVPHTVTWQSGPGTHFDSGPIKPGKHFITTITSTGTITYHSKGDPGMTAKIEANSQ